MTVKALDDVSVCFPETGMVFLLGKSGSGKSTLLNVCGGLDSPTEGEIIVKGRSSLDFSQSDFDSYRNTFVGFIFQEYNILNEFSVEDNIALALELQGKPKDKKAVAALLDDVDLTGYAKRKPNTLSGGQKQRIAIARALVKAPEIIMADEPTGALDSATGKQVFDTLKKLSKEKLVLVVSHDRDFAEQYGDRIIELMDGKIISDVTKTTAEKKELSGNVTVVGDTLCVKNGEKLSESDFSQIRSFLSKSKGDVMIASGEKEVKAFKAVSRITDDGEQEVFRDTNEDTIEQKEYTAADSKFIRSKLPMRHAMKIGVSGLKTKPIRLFFTIMLCTVAFILFGLFSTLTFYDAETTFKQTFKDSNYSTVRLVKEYYTKQVYYMNGKEQDTWDSSSPARFTQNDLNTYVSSFGPEVFGGVQAYSEFSTQTSSAYWKNNISFFAYLPATNSMRARIQGTYPTADNEIVLSSYSVNTIINCKATDSQNEPITINSANEIIGRTLYINGKTYKVTGYFDSGSIDSKFDVIRDGGDYSWNLTNEYETAISDGLHTIAFVSEKEVNSLAQRNQSSWSPYQQYHPISVASRKDSEGNWQIPEHGSHTYYAISNRQERTPIRYLNEDMKLLQTNQVIVSAPLFYESMYGAFETKRNELQEAESRYYNWRDNNSYRHPDFWTVVDSWEKGETQYIPDESDTETYALYQEWLPNFEDYKAYNRINTLENYVNTLQNGFEWVFTDENKGEQTQVPLTAEKATAMQDELFAWLAENNVTLEVAARLYNNQGGSAIGEAGMYTIIGVTNLDKRQDLYNYNYLYFNDAVFNSYWQTQKAAYEYYEEYFTSYVEPAGAIYNALFLPYNHSDAQTDMLYNFYANKEFDANDSRVYLSCGLMWEIEMVDDIISTLSQVFLWIGIVLAIFAALLLSNFISVSINHKKREIGILRAVGARGFDVFKIFFSESFVITFICVFISLIGCFILCQILNTQIAGAISATIFNFGFFSIASLLAIAILTAVLATFLPVWNAARKKPVDSIRAL